MHSHYCAPILVSDARGYAANKGGMGAGARTSLGERGLSALRADAPDLELVRQARRGDTDAFRALYERHSAGTYALARSLLGDAGAAEDVVQVAFVRAWEALPRLRTSEAFGVWVRRIARRAAIDEVRRRVAHPETQLEELDDSGSQVAATEPLPEDEALSADFSARVRSAVDRLPEHQRTAVVLHHIDGLDVRSAAKVLGVPVGTVLSRLARAREALARKLTGGDIDGN